MTDAAARQDQLGRATELLAWSQTMADALTRAMRDRAAQLEQSERVIDALRAERVRQFHDQQELTRLSQEITRIQSSVLALEQDKRSLEQRLAVVENHQSQASILVTEAAQHTSVALARAHLPTPPPPGPASPDAVPVAPMGGDLIVRVDALLTRHDHALLKLRADIGSASEPPLPPGTGTRRRIAVLAGAAAIVVLTALTGVIVDRMVLTSHRRVTGFTKAAGTPAYRSLTPASTPSNRVPARRSATPASTPSTTPSPGRGTDGGQIRGTGFFVGLCVDVRGPSAVPGPSTRVQIWTCEQKDEMTWTRTTNSMVVGYAGLCMTVSAAIGDGSPVYMDNCRSGDRTQQWAFRDNGNIVNAATNRCLDIQGPSTNLGTAVQVWTCENVDQHHWIYTG